MLTDKEAFKVGFLKRCADAGMDAKETLETVKTAKAFVKSAVLDIGVKDIAGPPWRAAWDVASTGAKTLGNWGLMGALAGPAVLGGAAGYGMSRLTDIDDTDVDEIKKREIIDEYYRQIELLKSKRRGTYKRPSTGM